MIFAIVSLCRWYVHAYRLTLDLAVRQRGDDDDAAVDRAIAMVRKRHDLTWRDKRFQVTLVGPSGRVWLQTPSIWLRRAFCCTCGYGDPKPEAP